MSSMSAKPATRPSILVFSSISALVFSSLILLPQCSPVLFAGRSLSQRSSLDRPEHPFLTPITSTPLLTLVWTVLGTFTAMHIWSRHLQSSVHGSVDRVWTRARDAVVVTLGIALGISVILLLLGAPLDDYLLHTFLLSSQIGLLTIFPIIQCYGIPSLDDSGILARYRLKRLVSEFSAQSNVERVIIHTLLGTLTGAWTGASALALDWDRPWQSYPLTPAFGAILGFTIGGLLSYA